MRPNPETFAVPLTGWYLLLLWLGIPTLPSWGHVAGAVAWLAVVTGAVWAAVASSAAERRRSLVVLGAATAAGIALSSLSTAALGLSVTQFVHGTLVGLALVSLVGACLFVGLAVATVSVVAAGRRAVAAR